MEFQKHGFTKCVKLLLFNDCDKRRRVWHLSKNVKLKHTAQSLKDFFGINRVCAGSRVNVKFASKIVLLKR